jgi:hypothetical protein
LIEVQRNNEISATTDKYVHCTANEMALSGYGSFLKLEELGIALFFSFQ